jgi:OPT family oligopeptide transporter
MPVLTGVSIFCLAKQDSIVFTNLFGGAQGNEGLGFLSFCFDWQYIASTGSPLWVPLQTLINSWIGSLLCVALFMALYYGNVWRALDFPFLAQQLFDTTSNSTNYVSYNQTAILNAKNEIDPAAVAQQGLPYLTATYIGYLITTNMGLSAAVVHMILFNYDDVKSGWSFLSLANLRKLVDPSTYRFWEFSESAEQKAADRANPDLDPHYKLLLDYKQVPQWWWAAVLAASFAIGIACIYVLDSTLPWWGYIIAVLLATFMILFFGAQMAITGFQFNQQPIIQMIAGYCHPNRPIANMYFTIFGYNSVWQGQLLLKDLKLAQFAHLSPRTTFFVQLMGSTCGAVFNYIIMVSIVDNQATILKSIEGSNIWSGQNLQQYNSLAVAWSLANDMFSVGGRYQWVTLSFLLGFLAPLPLYFASRLCKPGSKLQKAFSYWNTSIILWYMGYLFVGINSSITMYFLCGFIAQFYLRKYHPRLFVEYNYLVSAALDGGTQVIVFILSFAVDGASGKAINFPVYWGNTADSNGKNIDYCLLNPANGG